MIVNSNFFGGSFFDAGFFGIGATIGGGGGGRRRKRSYYKRDIEEEFRINYGVPTVKQVERLMESATDNPDEDDELIIHALTISGVLH